MMEGILNVAKHVLLSSWEMLNDMSPYLLFGFLVAGILSVVISQQFVERHLGGGGIWPIFKAAMFGIPLPLCSCGVIPVTASLRKHGASRGATISFLISTPQTGVDSILVTYSMLGFVFTIFRPIAALVNGMIGGIASMLFGKDKDLPGKGNLKCSGPCCAAECQHENKIIRALRYGFVDLAHDIGKPLLIGILIAGVISAAVPDDFFADALGVGFLPLLVMMAVGIPIYVCATASVPIAAALIMKGVSPGAALVFLMTGPATNAAGVAMVWKILGRRTALTYLISVALTALASGFLLDQIFVISGTKATADMPWMLPGYIKIATSVLLLVILLRAVFTKPHSHVEAPEDAGSEMKEVTIEISGMTCGHCVKTITDALLEQEGVASVDVSLSKGRAVVSGKDLDVDQLKRAIEELGYGV